MKTLKIFANKNIKFVTVENCKKICQLKSSKSLVKITKINNLTF